MSTELALATFGAANVVIGLGYLFVAIAIAPHFVVRLAATRWGGILFFLTSAWTHFEIARATWQEGVPFENPYHYAMLALQFAQAVAVWLFVIALWIETRRPPGDTPRPEHD